MAYPRYVFQTGYFIPYLFRIIPIDILAEIMVSNVMAEKNKQGKRFIRPALEKPITHEHFQPFATTIFGFQLTDRQTMYDAAINKRKFNFMVPENFNELLEKVNALPAVMPDNIIQEDLPDSSLVILSNLNKRISNPKYQKYFIPEPGK